ncbi:MAG: hypothetical protein ACKOCO_08940 [Bacteroidota bacterium]
MAGRLIILLVLLCGNMVSAQKMLQLEKKNRVKTTRFYTGDVIRYRMNGSENYWYERTITDILPESRTLMLDNFAVRMDSIAMMKVQRKPAVRLLGGALLTLGATLALSVTVGRVIFQDRDIKTPELYALSGISTATGFAAGSAKKIRLGKKYRLRIIEIRFPGQ